MIVMEFNDMVVKIRNRFNSTDMSDVAKNFNGDIRDSVNVGDIYYATYGWSMTLVRFYEVASIVGSQTAILRELKTQVVENNGFDDYSGKIAPILGDYTGEEFRCRATTSYHDSSVAFHIKEIGSDAIKWDGQPKRFNTCD